MCFSCLHIYVKILNCYSPFTCENFVQGEDSPSLCEFLELDDVHTPAGHMIMCYGKGVIRHL